MTQTGRSDIRDRYGKLLGYITFYDNGYQEIRDSYGRLHGYYDAQGNVTRTSNGSLVAYGNVLSSLLGND